MSFPFHTNDIHYTLNLITTIIASLHRTLTSAAHTHFQSLVQELQALQRSLTEIDTLAGDETQIPEISALKFASCGCRATLERFWERLRPFEDVLGEGVGKRDAKGAWKKTPRMVRWELLVRKEVPEQLRTYLVAHVGSLNLRLSTALLTTAAKSRAASHEGFKQIEQSTMAGFEQLNADVLKIRDRVAIIPSEDTIPTLNNLLEMTTRVWQSNNLLMDALTTLKNRAPSPDLRYTWAQAPAILEDALGRYLTIPSEYDWEKVEAIIQVQFKSGPGSAKVKSGEYELCDAQLRGTPLLPCEFALRPGMRIVMAVVIGQYQHSGPYRCPRLECKAMMKCEETTPAICVDNRLRGSADFERHRLLYRQCKYSRCTGIVKEAKHAGPNFMSCESCAQHFRVTNKHLFRPLKPPNLIEHITSRSATSTPHADSTIQERMRYKNISICFSDLPTSCIQSINRRNGKAQTTWLRGNPSMRPRHHTRSVRTALPSLPIGDPHSKSQPLQYPLLRVSHARHHLRELSNSVSGIIGKYPCSRELSFPAQPALRTIFYKTKIMLATYHKEAQIISRYLTRLDDVTRLKTRTECYDARRFKPLGDSQTPPVMIIPKYSDFWRLEQVIADLEILLRRCVQDEAIDNEVSTMKIYLGNLRRILRVL